MAEPDYMIRYREFWAALVETDGVLDLDKVARELSDYSVVMDEASKVYDELAGLSKPNTAAHHVIDGARARFQEQAAFELLEALLDDMECDADRQALIDHAKTWSPGVLQEYEQYQRVRHEIAQQRVCGTEALDA